MQNAIKRAALLEGMRQCSQTEGMTILQHGEMVRDYYQDIRNHFVRGTALRYEWRLPSWIEHPDIWDEQYPEEIMAEYHVFHDCGKPLCLTVDDEDKRHFPDHAAASKKAWLETGGSQEIGDLIGMDMDIHILKAEQLAEFASRPQALSLLITGLAEIHANASMFGGIESTSFKIKWKHIEKRGRQILALRREQMAKAA